MLRRIHVDNYKCLVDFDLAPGPFTTLFGENGTGKTCVFECVRNIRDFLRGGDVSAIFRPETLTRWRNQDIQTFGVDVAGSHGVFSYSLAIEFGPARGRGRVLHERLRFNGSPLLEATVSGDDGEVRLLSDGSSRETVQSFSRGMSGLAAIQERTGDRELSWFRRHMDSLLALDVDPHAMAARSAGEDPVLKDDGSNFLDWCRALSRKHPEKLQDLCLELAEILPEFKGLKPERMGCSGRGLRFPGEDGTEFGFGELSEGQKVLVLYYSLLHLPGDEPATILLDEPENFIAIREIQPLLFRLMELVEDERLQVILISHSPEVMNLLGRTTGYRLCRQANAATRIASLSQCDSQLPVSELMARGWME